MNTTIRISEHKNDKVRTKISIVDLRGAENLTEKSRDLLLTITNYNHNFDPGEKYFRQEAEVPLTKEAIKQLRKQLRRAEKMLGDK